VAKAFALDQPPLPEPAVVPPPSRTREPLDDFRAVAEAVPVESLDAMAMQTYAAVLWAQALQKQREQISWDRLWPGRRR